MAHIPGLRSPYDSVGGIVYFGRMLDKIRLHARGELPPDYAIHVGEEAGGFDQRCLHFLHLNYEALVERTLAGGTDEDILAWAFTAGRQPTEEEIKVWNAFMMKLGWRDAARSRVLFRLNEAGFPPDCGVETMFDFIDKDEGRPQRSFE